MVEKIEGEVPESRVVFIGDYRSARKQEWSGGASIKGRTRSGLPQQKHEKKKFRTFH